MPSVSPDRARRRPSPELEHPPARLAGRFAIAVMVVLLASLTAGSTATVVWILGTDRLPLAGFLTALAVVVLALSPLRARWGVPLSLLLAIAASLVAAGWHPFQPPAASLQGLHEMLVKIAAGEAGDSAFPDFLFDLALAANAIWLGWFALRPRRPLIAVAPSAAIIATNVLNSAQGQVGYVLGLMLCCCGLLLVNAYERSLEDARRRHVWVHDDVRWNFWEMGVLVTLLVLAITAFLPPVSSVNRTVAIQNEFFHGLNQMHAQATGGSGSGPGTGATIGYSRAVRLTGPLRQSGQVVFTYSSNLDLPQPYYFAGNAAVDPVRGAWQPAEGGDSQGILPRETKLPWAEAEEQQQTGVFNVTVKSPPAQAPRTLFYPGRLVSLNVPAQLLVRYAVPRQDVVSVDSAEAVGGVPRSYQVNVTASSATEAQLQAAGTAYPSWTASSAQPLGTSYLPQPVLDQVHQLALQATAGVPADVYDQATAIQNYLRSHYKYTLRPKAVPRGEDALQAFLNGSTGGYCVYFATAMADMLRSLGIPVVLESGFGPGTFNTATGRFVVRASDAHTWPVVYFPGYGWISFEPTPQSGYGVIPRGGQTRACIGAACALAPVAGSLGGSSQIAGRGQTGTSSGASPVRRRAAGGFPTGLVVAAVVVVVLLLVLLALAVRWLRPTSLGQIWSRTRRLAALAGVPERSSDSPLEFGRRLATAVPGVAEPARLLADQVSVAAYSAPGTAPPASSATTDTATEAWVELRGRLVPLVAQRALHRGRPQVAG